MSKSWALGAVREGMFIHPASCPVWADPAMTAACTCPREWRIRKDRAPRNAHACDYPWLIARRQGDGTFQEMMRARTWPKAFALVCTFADVTARVRANPAQYRSVERCPRPW